MEKTLWVKEKDAFLHRINHPEEYCSICEKKIGICKHTKCQNCGAKVEVIENHPYNGIFCGKCSARRGYTKQAD